MNYKEMKLSHAAQIEALLVGDYETLEDLLSVGLLVRGQVLRDLVDHGIDAPRACRRSNHQDVWAASYAIHHSLFGALPGTLGCLTQIKMMVCKIGFLYMNTDRLPVTLKFN